MISYEERKKKLVRVIETADTDNPEVLAGFLMSNSFDYVPYVAALASVRTLEEMDKRNRGEV